MAISYKKDDQLENLFANFAKLPDNMDSDPKKGEKKAVSNDNDNKSSN